MKSLQGQSTENTFDAFGFDVLSNEEMYAVKGGDSEPKAKTRPIDIFELD